MTTYYKVSFVALFSYKTHRLLAHNDSLHRLHLGHVVIIGPQLPFLYPLVDSNQQVPRYILTIVYALGGNRKREGFRK